MSTIDATVSVMKELPEETRKQVLFFATYKLNASKPLNSTSPHSDEELISILEHSDKQYNDGKALDIKTAIRDARKQHGYI